MLGKGCTDLYKAPTKEESKKLRRDGNRIKFIDFRFERRTINEILKDFTTDPYKQ